MKDRYIECVCVVNWVILCQRVGTFNFFCQLGMFFQFFFKLSFKVIQNDEGTN